MKYLESDNGLVVVSEGKARTIKVKDRVRLFADNGKNLFAWKDTKGVVRDMEFNVSDVIAGKVRLSTLGYSFWVAIGDEAVDNQTGPVIAVYPGRYVDNHDFMVAHTVFYVHPNAANLPQEEQDE